MSIASIFVDEATYLDLGIGYPELPLLQPVRMSSLGRVVVLAGPNGGGKSRLLRMIPKLVNAHLNAEARKTKQEELTEFQENIQTWKSKVLQLREQSGVDAELEDAQLKLHENEGKAKVIENRLRMTELMELQRTELPSVVHFVPKVPDLVNPASATDDAVEERSLRMEFLGSEGAQQNAPAYVREVMRASMQAQAKGDKSEQGRAFVAQEAELQEALGKLLGAKVVPILGKSLNLEIHGNKLDVCGLSPGQQLLFQFACMLHAQGKHLSNCVVLMDEPENHLHPKVMLEVVDAIISKLGHGQLWVATHSVPLVAHLAGGDPSCLWLVEEGEVNSARRGPTKVLDSLMGGPDGTSRLREFMRLPEQYAALRFLAECLEPPGVVGADVKDPQTNQISDVVRARARALSRPLRLLDYGAGKARLLATLIHGTADPKTWLDYYAFDIDATNEAARRKEIVSVYGRDVVERSLTEAQLSTSALNDGSVDIIVVCNVLHEIDPDDWLDYFGLKGRFTKLLRPDGYLLLVEDYGIPIGERAHRYGFLLLDQQELKELFDLREEDWKAKRIIRETPSGRYKDRLVAHLVNADCLARATPQTRFAAITKLKTRMTANLRTMLSKEKLASDAQIGRDYARTAQLLANAEIWLRDHEV